MLERRFPLSEAYALVEGVFRPTAGVVHRDDEYDPHVFDTLQKMQSRHFWYRGRHRFLTRSLQQTLARLSPQKEFGRFLDLGGGTGGWIRYLHDHGIQPKELALADSSDRALDYATSVVPKACSRYQVDILRLQWAERWDVVFLLDVLEHIPEDSAALEQVNHALSPGGLLFVTTPALKYFWTYNDDAVNHVRRYSKADFRTLARDVGFELLDVRYFFFFLSPLLLASRWWPRETNSLTEEDRRKLIAKTHSVPHPLVNESLFSVFAAETPLGHFVPFPFGTSILGVFRKPLSD